MPPLRLQPFQAFQHFHMWTQTKRFKLKLFLLVKQDSSNIDFKAHGVLRWYQNVNKKSELLKIKISNTQLHSITEYI